MLVYPSSMPVSNRALRVLADALRQRRSAMGSRWRRLPAGEQALLVLAHLNKGETYTALAGGFGVGTTTVFRYVREGVDVLAGVAPTLDEALDVAREAKPKALVLYHFSGRYRVNEIKAQVAQAARAQNAAMPVWCLARDRFFQAWPPPGATAGAAGESEDAPA